MYIVNKPNHFSHVLNHIITLIVRDNVIPIIILCEAINVYTNTYILIQLKTPTNTIGPFINNPFTIYCFQHFIFVQSHAYLRVCMCINMY